jgi:V/A-type H+-transporting ATPase subunit A
MSNSQIVKVSGPLVVAKDMPEARMYDVVKVGKQELIGEIVEIKRNHASIQVYEETGGLGPGDPVLSTGSPLSVELGPGMLEAIFDGIQRPLASIYDQTGDLIERGVAVPSLNRDKKWDFNPKAKQGDMLVAGDLLGVVQENAVIEHRILVPYGIKGQIKQIKPGKYTLEETIAVIRTDKGDQEICMLQRWPVRQRRPYKQKLSPNLLLSSGQRIIDALFPLAKGGTACIPGPFGSGKTVVQHQLAKWADADIVVYIGCGERGNEMTDVLIELPEIKDPRTGEALMKRSVLIANTSNMPVAAREASIYTGITIAEYFRDMGYDVALMADSTSRWAEALREMSGRLEEMPGEEGYPAYLSTKLADFYERAGRVITLGQDQRIGSISAIGAVSPPGGDMSDPVVQATLKVVKVFWGLDDKLAFRRHFPAINWLSSYSLYVENLLDYFGKEIAPDWMQIRQQALALLQKEAELEEIVRLIGKDSLSPQDQLTMEIAKIIREDFLHQNAFHEIDSYTSLKKQYRMLKVIMLIEKLFQQALERKILLSQLLALPVIEELPRAKFIAETDLSKFELLEKNLQEQIEGIK